MIPSKMMKINEEVEKALLKHIILKESLFVRVV